MKKYKKITIDISGNRKTSNAIDTVRGCTGAAKRKGGCYGSCYAAKLAHMAGIDFSKPVRNILDEARLEKQLAKNESTWIRIGVSGDPSLNWKDTVRVCELTRAAGKIPVLMTKAWVKPTDEMLKKLAACKTQLQISISALDTKKELLRRLDTLRRYAILYKDGCTFKVTTAPFSDPKIKHRQDELMALAKKNEFKIMELPLRTFQTSSYADKLAWNVMRKHVSPISGKEDNQWTAGMLYKPDDFIKKLHRNKTKTYFLCDEVTCDSCKHKCLTE